MKLKTLLGTGLLCAAFAGHATPLVETGSPQEPLPRLSSYGVDVPTKAALRALVPAGWVIFAHRDVRLPETLNWRAGDTWPQALSAMAQARGVAVKLDWTQQAVYLSPDAVAEVAGADVVAAMNPRAKTFTEGTLGDVLRHLVDQHKLAVAYEIDSNPPLFGPVTLLGVDAGEDLDLLAKSLGTVTPVTFVLHRDPAVLAIRPATSIGAKVEVALGPFSGVLAQIPAPIEKSSGPVIIVRDAKTPEVVSMAAAESPAAPAAQEVQAVESVPAIEVAVEATKAEAPKVEPVETASSAPEAPVAQAEPVQAKPVEDVSAAAPKVDLPAVFVTAAKAPQVELVLAEGDSLRDGLRSTLEAEGWNLVWRATPEDLHATVPATLAEASVEELLNRLLPRIGMRADVFLGNKTVVIRNASNQVNP